MSGAETAQPAASSELHDERPWVRHYPAGVDPEVMIPDITLPEMLARTRSEYGRKTFGVFYGRNYSFREVDDDSNRFANRLIELGLQPGDPVMLLLPNVPQFLIVAYGVLKAGGIVASINPLLTRPEIETLARDSGARMLVTLDRFWDVVEPLVESGPIARVIVTGVQDGLPRMKRWMYPLRYGDEIVEVPHKPERGRYQFLRLMKGAPSAKPDVRLSPDDIAVFQYTGGTTGVPKAAMLTHRNLVSNTYQVRGWLPEVKDAEETVMAILPFFHAYGGTLCLFLAVQAAARLVLVPRFDVKEVMEIIASESPTVLPGVPTLYNALNRAAENNPARQQALKSLRISVSGGAPLAPDIVQRFESLSGGHLVEGYGLSEASPVTHVNPVDGRARTGTIGLPIPNTEVRLLDPHTGQPVPTGEPGELVIRGPQIMRGYWNKPEDTAQVLDDEGWLHTGDMATMDEDGFFRIVDRLKDVIITGGENVYPREIEDVLASHPKIHEVAVAGVAHEIGGEVAKAYIVLRPGETMTRREVLQFCGERLARYKVPRQVEFRDELPKSEVGKIIRRKLEPQGTDDRQT